MKIAMLGTRGIPASYSGFETCVEQLGQRLVERGHEITVYCRSHHIHFPEDHYKGMELIKLPTVQSKYLDTIVHTVISSIHTLGAHYDIALYFIAGNSPLSWIPRIVGTKTLLNVDGLDWKREKWPSLAKRYIRFAEYLSTKMPNVFLTDSTVVQEYYQQQFGKKPAYVPYGSDVEITSPGETLEKFHLSPRKYFLFVGRLVPDNCAHHLVEAFRSLKSDFQCVIVGDAPYAAEYQKYLKNLAGEDPRIQFTGYVFGKGYSELSSNAYAFIETSAVGGTHPALLEAMAFGNCVVVNDTAENIETIADAGLKYSGTEGPHGLRPILENLLNDPHLVESYRSKAKSRANAVYSWDKVADAYERLFFQMMGQRMPERLTASITL